MSFDTEFDTSGLSELGRAAVWYCENGFAIIPIEPRGKKPYAKVVPNGLNDWFDNPEDAHKLWEMIPDLNIAIVCGKPSGNLTVFDFDEDDEKGISGSDTLADYEDENGSLAYTATALTGRGGMHYLYRDSRSYRPSVNRDLGVDVRSEGSYIVAPPSMHPCGRAYAWNIGDAPWERDVAMMGENEHNFLDYVQRNGGQDQDSPVHDSRFKLPARIKSGERNDTLYRYGCSLRTRGYADDAIDAMLRMANEKNCIKPMGEDELSIIVRQVCKRGPGYDGNGTFRGDSADVGAPGTSSSGGGDDVPNFRTSNGQIKHNLLAQAIIQCKYARIIDGVPAVWTGQRWEFGKAAINRICIELADDIKKSVRDEVFSYIQACGDHYSSDREFDGRFYVQFLNGTYDVLSGRMVEPNHDMYIIGTLPIALDLSAPPGVADDFLASLANHDDSTEKVLSEVIGVCMCSKPAIDQSPMLIGKANVSGGEASNGKSTYIKSIQSLLGPVNYSSLDIATLAQRFQAGRIVGKLANLGDDIPNGFLHGDELSMFKKLVTCEQIYTDIKNGEGFEFVPSATMVFSMNSMPRLADTTDGVFRRLAFVPFRSKFAPGMPNYDPHISEKLAKTENLQRLAVLGLMTLPDLISRGELTHIPDMEEEVEQVRIDNDVVRRWVASDCIEESDLDGRWLADVYEDFKKWAAGAGENTVKRTTFRTRTLAVFGRLETYETRDRAANKRGQVYRMRVEE